MKKSVKHRKLLRLSCATLIAIPLIVSTALYPLSVHALAAHGTGVQFRESYWINDPDYTFSKEYKTSVWYNNFSALSLSDNDRNNVMRVALSQLGYHEGNSEADFDGENQNGTQNYIEYARLVYPWWANNHYEWCACFVNWCLSQAGVDYAHAEISCWQWATWFKNNGIFQHALAYNGSYKPQPADFIFFSRDSINTTSNHVGLVLYTTDSRVYTVEGNTSDCVAIRSYSLSDSRIIGYGTPNYKIGKERTISYKPTSQFLPGSYIVNSTSGAYVRLYEKNSSTSSYTNIPNGAMVTIKAKTGSSNSWIAVRYGNKTGYVSNNSKVTISLLAPATYSLVYIANGGEDAPDTQYDFCYSDATVSHSVPTKNNAVFLGWSEDPNATDRDLLLQSGDEVTLEQEVITLYAIWEELPVESELESESEGGSTADQETTTFHVMTSSPENLTTITGGSNLPAAQGCSAVFPAVTSIFLPISLTSLLLWRRKRDDYHHEDEEKS